MSRSNRAIAFARQRRLKYDAYALPVKRKPR